jgi:hypothetical protein
MRSIFQYFSQTSSDGNAVLAGLNQTGLIFVLCLFSLLCVLLSGFILLLYFRNNNRLKEIGEKLDALELKVQSQEYSRNSLDNRSAKQMDKDELKSRFEKITANKPEFPEKYRHVAQLERSGLGVKEIAEIMDVSQNEAEQMLSLARLSNDRSSV